ncbi:substrate-binding domain-containing protein [Scytonema sp. PCC 10023]|uniref:PstS family phosphate ABC transporter substrate-binding protein n=1 Tax=Scytonema sp. PCC 10023 TaxID=1680591 RepID=UPI0039C671DE
MNTNESNAKGSIICSWCSYHANPKEAKYCQKCGKPLVNRSVAIKDRITKYTVFATGLSLSAIMLLLFGLGSYFFWQQTQSSQNVNSKNVSSNNSDIQSYTSMKEVPKVPEGTFNFGGSLIFASLVAQGTHKAINQAHPNFILRYTDPVDNQPGTGKGIEMLLNGQLSFALSGRPLEDIEYKKANERGFKLDQVAVAIDGLGCYTHPDISIPGLSVAQLQAIYTGKITNWKEVGGPNLPIVTFSINTKTTALLKTLLGSKIGSVSPKVRSSRDYTVLVRDVASTPGAIGIGAAMLVATQQTVRPVALASGDSKQYIPVVTDDQQLNIKAFQNGTYPITRYLYIIIRRDGRADEQAGVAYGNLLLSKEGQQFVQKAGLVPIR